MADPLLLQLVHHSLTEWPALQLAIEHGMGGAVAREKQTWMAQTIYEFLLHNKHVVDGDELHDYISDIMDEEFNTIVDDGSMSILTQRIIHYCKLLVESNEQELVKILDKKKNEIQIANRSVAAPTRTAPAVTPATASHSVDEVGANSGDGEDEWTLVTRKSNRRT